MTRNQRALNGLFPAVLFSALVGMAFTASYVRSLPPEQQDRFRRDLEALLARHGLANGDRFSVPYRIDLWTARRPAQ